jgi:hypothetical protein
LLIYQARESRLVPVSAENVIYEAFVVMGVVGIDCTEKGKSGDMFVLHPSKPLYLFPSLQNINEEKHHFVFPIKTKVS